VHSEVLSSLSGGRRLCKIVAYMIAVDVICHRMVALRSNWPSPDLGLQQSGYGVDGALQSWKGQVVERLENANANQFGKSDK
jgi:hypothetical protein